MKSMLFLFINWMIVQYCHAQAYLNTPLEILTFMEASPTTYEFEQLYGTVPSSKKQIIPHGTFIQSYEGKEHQLNYSTQESASVQKWKNKARMMTGIEKPNYKRARQLYMKCLNKMPDHAQIITFLGESYLEDGKLTEAKIWLQKAIDKNPIDYLAQWYLAEIHLQNKQLDSAIVAITKAHVFNRNHPRLLKRMIEIYKIKQLDYYHNWEFSPKMYVYKDGETVVITADGIWLTYGMYKAVWEYDTDYKYIKEQQAVTDYLFQQEMEATLGTFMTHNSLKKDDKRNYPSMEAFAKCLDLKMVEEFVMYEIMLKNNPSIAYHLTDEFMKKIIAYIQVIRSNNYVLNKKN